jgi:hypothetical protein
MTRPRCPTPLPCGARAGLMRAWLAILHTRDPGVIWIPVQPARPRRDCVETGTEVFLRVDLLRDLLDEAGAMAQLAKGEGSFTTAYEAFRAGDRKAFQTALKGFEACSPLPARLRMARSARLRSVQPTSASSRFTQAERFSGILVGLFGGTLRRALPVLTVAVVVVPLARSAPATAYRVARAIDGDTIELTDEQHVRGWRDARAVSLRKL